MKQIIKQIIKDEIDPLFKENGFKKKRNNFAKFFPDFAWVVNIQFSKWNTQEHIEFTFNVGISIDKLYGTYYEWAKPNFPDEVESVLRFRIRELKDIRKNDHWYVLNQNTSVDELKKLIQSDIQVIISHFERFKRIEDIIVEMENPSKLGMLESPHLLTVLYHQFGNIEKAQKRFNKIYSSGEDYQREFMKSFAERLGLQI